MAFRADEGYDVGNRKQTHHEKEQIKTMDKSTVRLPK